MSARVGITYRFDEKLAPYVDAVRHAGLDAVPLQAPGPYDLGGLDGLLISGGTDLNPELYGEDRGPETDEPDDERDEMELWLLQDAVDRDLPVLCICRGMQLFNVAFGGGLVQHLPSVEIHRQRGVIDAHAIATVEGTKLAAITGGGEFAVNSRHHQAVSRVGKGLVVSARSADRVIEGLELPGKRFAVAVQWHPEDRMPSRTPDTRLFEAFAAAVSG
jgi:putative glutamine amidotransferase